MIIYDNACNLHRYAMRRQPAFFANTRFAVDRMHFKGHKSCHMGYKLPDKGRRGDEVALPLLEGEGFKMPEVTMAKLNSQVAEQCNAKLRKIATQVAYMKQSNFMSYVKYYLLRCNMRLCDKFVVSITDNGDNH